MAELKHFCLAFNALQYNLKLLKQCYLSLFLYMPKAGLVLTKVTLFPKPIYPATPFALEWAKDLDSETSAQGPALSLTVRPQPNHLLIKTLAHVRVLIKCQSQTKHLHSLSHIILPINMWDRHYYHSHFIDVTTEALEAHPFVRQTPGAVLSNGNITLDERDKNPALMEQGVAN